VLVVVDFRRNWRDVKTRCVICLSAGQEANDTPSSSSFLDEIKKNCSQVDADRTKMAKKKKKKKKKR
jgi:hypothetical protein